MIQLTSVPPVASILYITTLLLYVCISASIQYTWTYICIYIYNTRTPMHRCVYVHMQCRGVYIYIDTYVYTYTYTRRHAYVHTCEYAHSHIEVCIYRYTHKYTHTGKHADTRTHAHAHAHRYVCLVKPSTAPVRCEHATILLMISILHEALCLSLSLYMYSYHSSCDSCRIFIISHITGAGSENKFEFSLALIPLSTIKPININTSLRTTNITAP